MKTQSFRTKLWLYFVLFAGIIFSLLWILQTVGLQRFYDGMMKQNIRSAAQQMAAESRDDDFDEIIDRFAFRNSLLIYVTDEKGKVLYSSDAYKPYFRQMGRSMPGSFDQGREKSNRRNEPQENFRSLPDGYEVFLEALAKSETGTVELTYENSYIYGCRITLEDDEPAILYTAGTLGAVGAAASIIRVQLLWVTGLSLVLAFVIAWIIARRFSRPVSQLNEQAKMLSEDVYEDHFRKGFCRELDELNESLSQSAEKLSEARDYQKELLANVSHDLRTPLTMIKGYAEMVRDISWEDEEQRTADTGVIIKEADRMTALVNEILEYSRLQKKAPGLNFSDVDFSMLTESVAARFEPLFRKAGGTVERNITPDCMVRGDAEMLERVVFNLIENAVRYSSGQDKRVIVSVRKEDDLVVLEVRDFGDGIAPEEIPHIWEKYYTSRQRGGMGVSGLGLAIVKEIALIHNAETEVQSEKGKGSTFRFNIKSC